MTDCEHQRKGRAYAQVIADLASEREAARITREHNRLDELEESIEVTRGMMAANFADHRAHCGENR